MSGHPAWPWTPRAGSWVADVGQNARVDVGGDVGGERLGALPGESQLEELAGHVASGELDPYTAADKLIGG